MADLRPMTDADVESAVEVWMDAFEALAVEQHLPLPHRTPEAIARLSRRLRHFLSTDPEGSFVADEDGRVVGLSQSLVREGYWMLSLLGIRPGVQGQGLGAALLELALQNASPDSAGTIQSSNDPAAMALYTRAGFDLHPALIASGPVVPGAVAPHPSVRTGDGDDVGIVDDIDRVVRGSARGIDIMALLAEPANTLLLADDRGYAVTVEDRLVMLGARDEDAAVAVLETALALGKPGSTFELTWLTASQQWAIRTVVAAGLRLHPYGAVMVRGMPGPPWPYIPSGGYG